MNTGINSIESLDKVISESSNIDNNFIHDYIIENLELDYNNAIEKYNKFQIGKEIEFITNLSNFEYIKMFLSQDAIEHDFINLLKYGNKNFLILII